MQTGHVGPVSEFTIGVGGVVISAGGVAGGAGGVVMVGSRVSPRQLPCWLPFALGPERTSPRDDLGKCDVVGGD